MLSKDKIEEKLMVLSDNLASDILETIAIFEKKHLNNITQGKTNILILMAFASACAHCIDRMSAEANHPQVLDVLVTSTKMMLKFIGGEK